MYEIVEGAVHRGIDVGLGECKRAMRITPIDHNSLRTATEERLTSFVETLKQPLLPNDGSLMGDFRQSVLTLLPKLDEHLQFAMRQFDVGLLDPAEPKEPLTMNNSVSIGVMSGGMVQQGTTHSTQSATDAFNAGDVAKALQIFADALQTEKLPAKQLADMQADIDTIHVQLAKDQPSKSILQETGKSIRSVVEGLAAGLLTDPTVNAARELFRVLGLS